MLTCGDDGGTAAPLGARHCRSSSLLLQLTDALHQLLHRGGGGRTQPSGRVFGFLFFAAFSLPNKNSYTVKTQTFAIAEIISSRHLNRFTRPRRRAALFQHERCYKLDTDFVLFFYFFYFIYFFFRNNDHLLCQ